MLRRGRKLARRRRARVRALALVRREVLERLERRRNGDRTPHQPRSVAIVSSQAAQTWVRRLLGKPAS